MNIAMICDYFYPNKGGIETHIKTISDELIKLGNNVIVITHKYKNYKNCVHIGNIIVYYLDLPIIAMNTTFPTLFTNYLIFKHIFEKHSINLVHGHQSLSNLCLEGIFHASNLNIKTVLTDHSVFETGKCERIIVDNLTSFLCKKLDFIICVSEISRKNTLKRIKLPISKSKVIPNGIIPEIFYPKDKRKDTIDVFKEGNKGNKENIMISELIKSRHSNCDNNINKINDKCEFKRIRIIVMSRLAFRKGIDLLIDAIPLICRNKNLEIIIVGDGPKRNEVEQMIFDNDLQDQVFLKNEIKHEEVGDILRSGDIFLNTSLTETFCMAILEAAACGLIVVSTNVGGIHEILPNDYILFVEPNSEDISAQIENATKILKNYNCKPLYDFITKKYSWNNIAKELQIVYESIEQNKSDFNSTIYNVHNDGFLNILGILYAYIQMWIFDFFNL